MYFKTETSGGPVRGYKVTAKEVQALTRFVVRQMQKKFVLETFTVTVVVKEKRDYYNSSFRFRYRHFRTGQSIISISIYSQITFPITYLGMRLDNLQQVLVLALGYCLACHSQRIVNTKRKQVRVYSRKVAEKAAQQIIQRFKVERLGNLETELNICIDESDGKSTFDADASTDHNEVSR